MSKTYYDESLLLKTNTENGRDWLRKYVHPPGTKGVSYNGYPDASTTNSVHSEYRLQLEGLPFAANQGINTGACLFLNGPGLLYPSFYATTLDGGNPTWTAWLANTNVRAADISAMVGRQRLSYLSETWQYDATAINNSGMVYSCQHYPSTYTMTVGNYVQRLSASKHPSLPSVVKSLIANGGKDVQEQIAQAIGVEQGYVEVPQPRVPIKITADAIQIVRLGKSILAPGDILELSTKAYMSRSVEGAFVVHQTDQPTNPFKAVRNSRYVDGAAPGNSLLLCCYEFEDNDGNATIQPFLDASGKNYIYDVEWSDWSWSYTMFTGCNTMDKSLNISCKLIAGFEFSPVVRSLLANQALPPSLYDPTALQTATVITQSRQDAMPAIYNAAGIMAALGSSLASGAVDMVAKAISGADAPKSEEKAMAKEIAAAPSPASIEERTIVANNALPPALKSRPEKAAFRQPKQRKPRPAPKKQDTAILSAITKMSAAISRLSVGPKPQQQKARPPRRQGQKQRQPRRK